MAHHHDRTPPEAPEPAHDGGVLCEITIAGQRREILDQRADVVEAMGTVGMAGDLCLLPGREFGVGVDQRLLRLLLQPRHLIGDRYGVIVTVDGLQLGNLALELRNRLLEVEIGANSDRTIHQLVSGRVGGKRRKGGWLGRTFAAQPR